MDDFKMIARGIGAGLLVSALPWLGDGYASTSAAVGVAAADGSLQAALVPEDTFININANNYSTDTLLATYTWPDYRVANAILMKFDLSAIPAGAVVQEAALRLALVASDEAAEATYTVTAHKLVGRDPVIGGATGYTADGVTGWTPNACCHDGVPLAQADISAAYDTRAIDKAPGYKTWAITPMVQEWLADPATNFGLLLNSDASKPRDRYRLFASREHPDGAIRPFLLVTYSPPPTSDETAPSVSITTPAAGATVSGAVTVGAGASDDVGVVGVQFLVDGTPLGAEDTSAPYEVAWDTAGAGNGTHTLTARARDAAGNTATSAAVTVTVANDSGSGVTRVEETSAAVAYADTGTPWTQGNTDRPWSGETAALGVASGQRATLSFSGTGVSWIGFRGPQAGIANVRLDGTPVATVDLFAPAEAVQAVVFTAGDLASGPHTLAIEATGTKNASSSDFFVVVDAFDLTSGDGPPSSASFERGDVLVSLETGPVQWRRPDGTLNRTLTGSEPGTGEGMGFDPIGNLYVTRWPVDSAISRGNTVEVFNPRGESLGTFGSGYDCAPHAIVFDAAGAAYVGQAACTGAILKFPPGQATPIAFAVAPDETGSFWIDLAADGCTIFYTSWGPNVKRFDTCTRTQLPDFNAAPLPSGAAQDLRILPDGGVLVSSGELIARLDASGALVRTYGVPGEPSLWAGLDLVGDGTFWAGNYESSNVYRFDLATGAVRSGFNTGTPPHTVVGVRVEK